MEVLRQERVWRVQEQRNLLRLEEEGTGGRRALEDAGKGGGGEATHRAYMLRLESPCSIQSKAAM